MFSSKKGMAFEELGKFLLILIGFIVLLFILLYVFAPNFMNDFWPCRLNILFRAKIPGLGVTAPLELKMCKTYHNDVTERNEDKIAKILGDRVDNCWGKYWNGNIDFFSDWSFTTNYRCMLCNVDRFKKEISEFIGEEYKKFKLANA